MMAIIEFQQERLYLISQLLGDYNKYPVVNAVIEGNSPGRVFVDNLTDPRSAFVLTNAGFGYLVGSSQNENFNQALKEMLDNNILLTIRDSDDPTLIFYPLNPGWDQTIKNILGNYQTIEIFRRQFVFNPDKFTQQFSQKKPVPASYKICPIDQTLLDQTGADLFPWESARAFLEKGFGFWLMAGGEIVCECSSVFAGGGAVEINIYTQEKYRRQGLAMITASAFIEECLVRGLRPNWECWWENEPSIALAQKLGFEPVRDHAVYLVEFEKTKS